MARLALAVGYTSRGKSRSEEPRLLYLGSSYAAAKAALAALPEGISYGEAYRLDSGPNKRFHAEPEAPNTDLPAVLVNPVNPVNEDQPEAPAPEPEPAAPAAEETSAEEPEGLAKVIGRKK
jgi:hypothetical protein